VLHSSHAEIALSPAEKRKSDLRAGDAIISRAVLPRKRDSRQPGIFDAPLPAFVGRSWRNS